MWWGSLDTQTRHLDAHGVGGGIPSPSGGIDMIRVIRGRASIQHTSVGSANNAIWNYVYADSRRRHDPRPESINNIVGHLRLYVAGNLCLNRTAHTVGRIVGGNDGPEQRGIGTSA